MAISQTLAEKANITIVNVYEVANGFRMMYPHLILAQYTGQSQGHANFHSEYLVNGE